MTPEIAEIRRLMDEFVARRLGPEQFVDQYTTGWKELTNAQWASIAEHPGVDAAVRTLQKQFAAGELSTADFESKVAEQWALLDDLPVRPGSELDRALSHVFVEADAYISDSDERDTDDWPPGTFVTADELRREVSEALSAFDDS